MTDTAAILSDLARATAVFQQRAIATLITGRIQPVSASLHANGEVIPLRIVSHNPSPKGR